MHWVARALRRRRSQRGAATVEFALVSIPMMVLMLGLMQYGWYFYVAQNTSSSAANVARRLEVGDCWAGNQALTLAQNQTPQVTAVSKSPATLSGASIGTTQITVTVTADAAILDFLPMPGSGIVTRTVKAQLEDDSSDATCP
jgi:Flp pilus assembly protein TadG